MVNMLMMMRRVMRLKRRDACLLACSLSLLAHAPKVSRLDLSAFLHTGGHTLARLLTPLASWAA